MPGGIDPRAITVVRQGTPQCSEQKPWGTQARHQSTGRLLKRLPGSQGAPHQISSSGVGELDQRHYTGLPPTLGIILEEDLGDHSMLLEAGDGGMLRRRQDSTQELCDSNPGTWAV